MIYMLQLYLFQGFVKKELHFFKEFFSTAGSKIVRFIFKQPQFEPGMCSFQHVAELY